MGGGIKLGGGNKIRREVGVDKMGWGGMDGLVGWMMGGMTLVMMMCTMHVGG